MLSFRRANLFERDPEHIRQLIDINLTGVLLCCQGLRAHYGGPGIGHNIINIALRRRHAWKEQEDVQ